MNSQHSHQQALENRLLAAVVAGVILLTLVACAILAWWVGAIISHIAAILLAGFLQLIGG